MTEGAIDVTYRSRVIERPHAYEEGARLPVPAGLGRGFVLASVFMCAACGLVYELELVALAAYLVGDSVTQASVVLSVMVFAMGVGSLLAKRLRCCAAVGFGYIEALLALVGGGSAMALYASFAWGGEPRIALVVISLAIGVLIGAEMPLLMTLIQRIRRQDPGGALADLFAADYVGALVGGLAFPFLLLPLLGQLTGGLLTGVVNAFAGGMIVLWLFRRDLSASARWRLLAANGVVLTLLVAGAAFVGDFERAARHAVYGGDVRVAVRTGTQELVLTGGEEKREWPRTGELRFFLDGRLSVRGSDEREHHEALVRPAMEEGRRSDVLVLGGGDGLAVREVLRYPDVRTVTVIELDPGVPRLARSDPGLRELNGGALDDPRVRVESADAFDWLRERSNEGAAPFDVILSGLPDPGISESTKLYSQEFYGLAERSLARGGRLAVHASSPGSRRRDFWTVEATLRSVGLRTCPYEAVSGAMRYSAGPDRSLRRSGSEAKERWGFVLAYRQRGAGGCALTSERYGEGWRGTARERVTGLLPSTLTHPRYLE